jgi:hypothetical protein
MGHHRGPTKPDEALAISITGDPLEEEFVSEGVYAGRIEERKLEFERPIGEAMVPLEECQDLF